jgi:hypothetical protein
LRAIKKNLLDLQFVFALQAADDLTGEKHGRRVEERSLRADAEQSHI